MKLTQKVISTGKYEIFYLDSGESFDQNHIVLFLHGWGLSSIAFEKSLELLSSYTRVIAPDLPGFGKSSPIVTPWNFQECAKAIRDFIEILGIEKVNLVGQSMGGGVSILLSMLIPSKINSLILIDSAGIPIGAFPSVFIKRLFELPAQFITTKFTLYHIGMLRAFLRNLFLRTKNNREALKIALSTDLSPLLSSISSPCLVIWGAEDQTIPLTSGYKLADGIKGAKIEVVENAYHEWSALMPNEFVFYVSSFIKDIKNQ